jgi:hypothetical protein
MGRAGSRRFADAYEARGMKVPTVVLDAGALIGVERGDALIWPSCSVSTASITTAQNLAIFLV